MFSIVMIDDVDKDIKKVSEALKPLANTISYTFEAYTNMAEGRKALLAEKVDLLLLDLEFSSDKEMSISLLDQISPRIPVIIVSNLTHYQRQLQLKINVIGFISKARAEEQLIPMIFELLIAKRMIKRRDELVFPQEKGNGITQTFIVKNIVWIELVKFKEYAVHMKDGGVSVLTSISFDKLCREIKDRGIFTLTPATRFVIVNTEYLKEVYIAKNGRLIIKLLGTDIEFTVAQKYAWSFRGWYLE